MKQINELSVIDRNGFVLIKIIIKNNVEWYINRKNI
mgnify:CR=1 FL=1